MAGDAGAGRGRRWVPVAQISTLVFSVAVAVVVGVLIGRATAPGPDIVVAAAPVVQESPQVESMPLGAPPLPTLTDTGTGLQLLDGSRTSPVINGAANLPDTPGTGTGYRVVRSGLDGPSVATALAQALGVEGQVVTYGDSWLIGAADGLGASVRVMDDALMSWSYSDPVAANAAERTAAPLQARSIALASALLTDFGVDVSAVDWQVERGDATTDVTAWQLVAGQRTQLGWRLVFGPGGSVVSATGFAGGLEELPDYAVVGARTAVDRSATPRWAELGAVRVKPPSGAPTSSATPSSAATGRALTVAVPEVTVTDARLGLAQYWQPDGQLLILPSYLLTAADGSEWSLIAVSNGYVDFVDQADAPAVRGGGEVR